MNSPPGARSRGVAETVRFSFGGSAILIGVPAALEAMKQLEAQLTVSSTSFMTRPSSTAERSRMPRIIIQANPPGGDRAEITFSERVFAANLDAPHYSAQLLERLTWATADAEALESRTRAREPGDETLPSPLPRRRRYGRDLAHPPRVPLGEATAHSA